MLRCFISVLLLSVMATAQQAAAPAAVSATFNISGTVVNDLTGQPLGRIIVATGPAQRPGAQTTSTDAEGHFNFTGLSQGKYWLAAQGQGFPRQLFDEHEFFSTAIAVGDAITSGGIIFRLRPGAVLTGAITDDQNEPLRNAQVLLFHEHLENGKRATTLQQRATTDDRGVYRFSRLAAGSYFVGVTDHPWYAQHRQTTFSTSTYNGPEREPTVHTTMVETTPLDVAFPLTFYPETTDSNSAAPILLKPGDRTIADVRLTAVPAMSLVIHQSNAGDLPNTSVTAVSQRVFGNFLLPVDALNTSSRAGEVKLTGLPPGQFTISTETNGANPGSGTQDVSLSQDGEVSLTKAAPMLTVHGVLTLEGAPVPPNAFVQFRSKDSEEVHGSPVSGKGEFEISELIRPGNYDVIIFNVPGAVVGSITRDGSPLAEGNGLDLQGSGQVQLGIKLVKGLGHIDGAVVKDGKPFPGAMVLLVPKDMEHHASQIRRDQSDSDGTFSLNLVLPGEYRVVAIQNGWNLQWANPNVLKPYLQHADPLQVVANQTYKIKVQLQ